MVNPLLDHSYTDFNQLEGLNRLVRKNLPTPVVPFRPCFINHFISVLSFIKANQIVRFSLLFCWDKEQIYIG